MRLLEPVARNCPAFRTSEGRSAARLVWIGPRLGRPWSRKHDGQAALLRLCGLSSLAQAEAEADLSGKEVFDLDAFEQCYDTSTDLGYLPPRDVREYRWKLKYYVQYPVMMTLKGFADFMTSLDVWR